MDKKNSIETKFLQKYSLKNIPSNKINEIIKLDLYIRDWMNIGHTVLQGSGSKLICLLYEDKIKILILSICRKLLFPSAG